MFNGRTLPLAGLILFLAQVIPAQKPAPAATDVLVGHWRSTTVVYENSQDMNLVLQAGGVAEMWVVTAEKRSQKIVGRWESVGKTLTLRFGEGKPTTGPYTMHEGKLVYPNIPNQRAFWDRLK